MHEGDVIYTRYILEIIKKKSSDSNIVSQISAIREVEEKVRNLAAHELVGVTKEWMEKRISFTAEELMDKLFQLAVDAGISISKEDRRIYQKMNEELVRLLYNER